MVIASAPAATHADACASPETKAKLVFIECCSFRYCAISKPPSVAGICEIFQIQYFERGDSPYSDKDAISHYSFLLKTLNHGQSLFNHF